MSASARSASAGAASSSPPTSPTGRSRWSAIVDVDEAALAFGREMLRLPRRALLHRRRARAFAAVPADFCTVVVPPKFHEAVVDAAIAHGLDILCEKPIADTMAGSLRVARKVREAGRKMAVTMSHRFDQDKTTLRAHHPLRPARQGHHGELPLRLRHARAHGLGRALPPHHAGPADDRGRGPPSRPRRRSRRRAAARPSTPAPGSPTGRATPAIPTAS